MSLTLHYHPLASFRWKALIALYENDTPFERLVVDLGDAASRSAFAALWPMAKMPVLQDAARDQTIPESSIIIEYLGQHYPGPMRLVPADSDLARQARLLDRFYDFYVQQPMQKIVTDRLRPAGKNDFYGVELARAALRTAYSVIEEEMRARDWAIGETFSMADCAAAPALFYAREVLPYGEGHDNVAAYLERLMRRPSFVRVIDEAGPFFHLFPKG